MDIECKKIKATFEDPRELFITGLCVEPRFQINKLEYRVSIKKNHIKISIKANESKRDHFLFQKMMEISKLIMLARGEFLTLKSLSFNISKNTNNELKKKAKSYQENLLRLYSTCNYFNSLFYIRCTGSFKSLLTKWIRLHHDIKPTLNLFFYSLSEIGFITDIRLAFIIQAFEPLYGYLCEKKFIESNHTKKSFSDTLNKLIMSNLQSLFNSTKNEQQKIISKYIKEAKRNSSESPIKSKIEFLISNFGGQLFSHESKASSYFIDELRNLRVGIFHASYEVAHNLNNEEQVKMIMKLSILYRVILLSYLGVNDHHNDLNFEYLIYAIDNWPNQQMHIFEWVMKKK